MATVLLESKFKEQVIGMTEFSDSIISIDCLFFHLKIVMDLLYSLLETLTDYYQAKTINTNVEIQVNDTRKVYHVR